MAFKLKGAPMERNFGVGVKPGAPFIGKVLGIAKKVMGGIKKVKDVKDKVTDGVNKVKNMAGF